MNKDLEETRAEIASRNLVLEKELGEVTEEKVSIGKENSEIKMQLDTLTQEKTASELSLQQKTEEYDVELQRLKSSLDKSTELTGKMKLQFQAKLKSLKGELSNVTERVRSCSLVTFHRIEFPFLMFICFLGKVLQSRFRNSSKPDSGAAEGGARQN